MRKTIFQSCTIVAPPGKRRGAAAGSARLRRCSFAAHRSSFLLSPAYTLIEVMVVAVIVILMLGMALPVFRVITGSRSEAGASNLIASMLGRARTDAIGLDVPVGVAVLYNPSSQLSYLAEVGFANCPQWAAGQNVPPQGYVSATIGTVTYYYVNDGSGVVTLGSAPTGAWSSNPQTYIVSVGGPPIDTLPNTELVPLPTGIGVQTLCNTTINAAGQRTTDGYLRVGVILFDGSGRMVVQNYGISQYSNLSKSTSLNGDYPVASNLVYNNYQPGVGSQCGLVVYQQEAFQGQQSPTPDPAYTDAYANQSSKYTGTGTPTQQSEETWLDQNATPLLIDRFTGTLIKAE